MTCPAGPFMLSAKWTVTPAGDRLLKVEYVMKIDPGGSVPAWMVNMVAAQAPFDSFTNLRRMIRERPSRKSKVTFIQDQ